MTWLIYHAYLSPHSYAWPDSRHMTSVIWHMSHTNADSRHMTPVTWLMSHTNHTYMKWLRVVVREICMYDMTHPSFISHSAFLCVTLVIWLLWMRSEIWMVNESCHTYISLALLTWGISYMCDLYVSRESCHGSHMTPVTWLMCDMTHA